jgi:AdoMet-dependent heme synthase
MKESGPKGPPSGLTDQDWQRAKAGDWVTTATFPHTPDKLFLIEIALTYDCQCTCVHCALGQQPHAGDLLTADEIIRLCRQAKETLGAEVVELFGGEPLVRDDVVEIVAGCAQYLRPWVSTNGLAFTREVARELKGAGLEMAIFSLDSAERETHDRIRGHAGCYDGVFAALEACHEVGIIAHLSTCVTSGMIDNGEVDRLIELTRKSKAQKLCLLPAKMGGRFAGNKRVLLDDRELSEIWRRTVRERGRVYVEAEANISQNISKCFCLRDWLYVNPYGAVQPCVYVFMDFGNVREEPIADIYRRMHAHPVLAERSLLNLCLMQNPEFVEANFSTLSKDRPLIKMK